jgi:hypothetical protein
MVGRAVLALLFFISTTWAGSKLKLGGYSYQTLSVCPWFVGALHCNAPYEVSVSNRGCVTRIWYQVSKSREMARLRDLSRPHDFEDHSLTQH